jgi:hypothetical protein
MANAEAQVAAMNDYMTAASTGTATDDDLVVGYDSGEDAGNDLEKAQAQVNQHAIALPVLVNQHAIALLSSPMVQCLTKYRTKERSTFLVLWCSAYQRENGVTSALSPVLSPSCPLSSMSSP